MAWEEHEPVVDDLGGSQEPEEILPDEDDHGELDPDYPDPESDGSPGRVDVGSLRLDHAKWQAKGGSVDQIPWRLPQSPRPAPIATYYGCQPTDEPPPSAPAPGDWYPPPPSQEERIRAMEERLERIEQILKYIAPGLHPSGSR